MPNINNISAPIVLISAGRSGTTLFSDIFERHPDFSACGETVDLIFDLWNAGQRSLSHIVSESLKAAPTTADNEVARFVRDGFLSLLEDDKSHWFQKPIGIPFSFSHALQDVDVWDEKAELYWNTMRKVFPQAQYFTILRHPCDIVMSYKNRFGCDEQRCWAILGFISHIVCHSTSPVRYAVPYDALVQDGETTLRSLLSFLDVEFHPDMMAAFDTIHSLNVTTRSSSDSAFTWQNHWDTLDPSLADERYIDAIGKLYRKFGHELDMPASFKRRPVAEDPAPAAVAASASEGEANIEEMRRYIAQLEAQAGNLNLLWEERAIRQDNELYQAYLKLENTQRQAYMELEEKHRQAYLASMMQIEQLSEGKAWLEQQCNSWRGVADEREKLLQHIELDLIAIEKGKIWLEQQCEAWRIVAEERQLALSKMEQDVAEIEKGKIWLEAQMNAWRATANRLERKLDAVSKFLPIRILRRLVKLFQAKPGRLQTGLRKGNEA